MFYNHQSKASEKNKNDLQVMSADELEDGVVVDSKTMSKKHNKDLNLLSDEDIQIESKKRSPNRGDVKVLNKNSDFNSDDERSKPISRNGMKPSESEPIEKPQSRNFGIEQKENYTEQNNNLVITDPKVGGKESNIINLFFISDMPKST